MTGRGASPAGRPAGRPRGRRGAAAAVAAAARRRRPTAIGRGLGRRRRPGDGRGAGRALRRGRAGGGRRRPAGSARPGLGASAPRWPAGSATSAPTSRPRVVQVMQRDAIERLDLRQLLLEPEMLDVGPARRAPGRHAAQPQPGDAGDDQGDRPAGGRARSSPRSSGGSRSRPGPRSPARSTGPPGPAGPRPRDIDWNRTIARQPRRTTSPSTARSSPSGWSATAARQQAVAARRRARHRPVRLDGGLGGLRRRSSAPCSASMRSLRTSLVVFDTAVVDLTEQLDDPVEVLFGTQLGGGTDINRALAYCQTLITRPRGHDLRADHRPVRGRRRASEMLRRVAALTRGRRPGGRAARAVRRRRAGVRPRATRPRWPRSGVPAFACTPDAFPDLLAVAIERRRHRRLGAARGPGPPLARTPAATIRPGAPQRRGCRLAAGREPRHAGQARGMLITVIRQRMSLTACRDHESHGVIIASYATATASRRGSSGHDHGETFRSGR